MDLQTVAEQNILGVAYLEAEDFQKSHSMFYCAMTNVLGMLKAFENQNFHPVTNENITLSSLLSLDAEHALFVEKNVNVEKEKVFVHAYGIPIATERGSHSNDDPFNAAILCAIILFNTGLLYHLAGLQEKGTERGEEKIRKAGSLYSKSFSLLSEFGISLESTRHATIDLLLIALLNNMAHISFEKNRYKESQAYFDMLVTMANTIAPTCYGDAHLATLMMEKISTFLLNARILQQPTIASAA